ncbi:MAG: hypothetical protein A3G40_10040 [Deltaproteobacteria bacterium RIFCSPLOWO2_12_FULL_57_22]|nr:MAG: hypothetical protein A3G40_10040 [Deltaproteobacteria bacterium RIFCSPLOWO2_12_FULL_57_22]
MIFGSAGIIAVDLDSNQLRLIHGSVSGPSLKVYDFAAQELFTANPENVAQQLEILLRPWRVGASSAALVLSGPEVVHRVLEFPPIPLKELGAVVGREIRHLGEIGGKELVFDWEVIEEAQAGNLEQMRVLVALAPKSQVDATLELLRRCRLKPALITTTPISLLRSLKYIRGERAGLEVALYLGRQQGYLLGLRHGAWSFLREFSSRSSEAEGEGLLEEAVREARRALLYYGPENPQRDQAFEHVREARRALRYYGQRQRGEQKITFVLGGENRLEALSVRLQRELGVAAEIARPAGSLDLDSLGKRASSFREAFPAFLSAIGLIAASAQRGINLAPKVSRKAVARQLDFDISFFQRPVWLLALFLLLVGVQGTLAWSESKYRRLLEERISLYAQWIPVAQAAEDSRALHENEKLLHGALGENRLADTSWVVLFKTFSRLVPPDLVLHALSVRRDQGKWQVALKGEVISVDLYSAQVAFHRFYQSLKSSRGLEGIELLPLHVSTVTETAPASAKVVAANAKAAESEKVEAPTTEIKKTKLQFELRANLSGK